MRRSASAVWYHFNQKESNKAECKYCKGIISITGGSTGNLRRHLNRKHPTVPMERTSLPKSRAPSSVGSWFSASASSLNVDSAPSPAAGSETSNGSFSRSDNLSCTPGSSTSLPVWPAPSASHSSIENFIQVIKPLSVSKSRSIDLQLLKMICKEYHPFSIVEDVEFRKLLSLLCPGYQLPSRKTLTRSLLPQTYNELVENIKEKLKSATAVAITTDGWTSLNNQSFLAITAHYFDQNTELCSNLLECIEFTKRHTAENLAGFLKEVIQKWELNDKIAAVVTDNAANIVAAVKLCKWRHIPCYAHTINLIVKAGIKPVENVFEKVKLMVQYFKKSSYALTKLHEMQKQMSLPELKLKQEVPTRWNSSYDMLLRVYENKAPIVSTLAVLGNDDFKFTADDWNVIKHSIKLLDIFYEVTKEISSEKSISLSKIEVLTRTVVNFLIQFQTNNTLPEQVVQMCMILQKQTEERLQKDVSEIVGHATMLDPRFKKNGFKGNTKFAQVYNSLINQVKGLTSSAPISQASPPHLARHSTSSSRSLNLWEDYDNEVAAITEVRDPKAMAIIEVDKFLSELLQPRNGDPLVWWEQRKLVYPHLYRIALKRLCIPASSVPCERIFSKAGQIMTEKRSRLGASKLTQIMFLNGNF